MANEKPLTDSANHARAHGSVDEIVDSVQEVRNSLAGMIVSAGGDPGSTRETSRLLGIDRNLVWLISKIIKADDILAAALDIPSVKRSEVICKACLQQGASADSVKAVREAMQRFEQVIEIYAGTRAAFTDLVHGMVYDDVTARQEDTRKAVFRGNSSIWGVQARVNFKTGICFPSSTTAGMVDAIRLGGLVGFKRLRPVPWSVFQMITHNDDGSVREVVTEPLDPAHDQSSGLPLVREFCTDPLLEIETVPTAFGEIFDLKPGPIGKVGLVDCVFGDIIRNLDQEHWRQNDRFLSSKLDLQTPSELVILDMFLHEDLSHQTPPDIMLVDRLSNSHGNDTALDERNQLPLSVRVMALPPGSAGGATSYFPGYPKLLDFAFERAGCSARHFRGFRFVMKYPVVPSALLMRMRKSVAQIGDGY